MEEMLFVDIDWIRLLDFDLLHPYVSWRGGVRVCLLDIGQGLLRCISVCFVPDFHNGIVFEDDEDVVVHSYCSDVV